MKYVAVGIIIVFILGGLTFAFFGDRPIQQEQTSTPVAQSPVQPQEPQTVPILPPTSGSELQNESRSQSDRGSSTEVGRSAISQSDIGAKPVEKIVIEDIKIGTGAEAKIGNTVSVQYTGTLLDGKKFDSSYDHGQPFSFTLGQGQVIQGWDQGVLGMKVGGKRKLTIPPSLAYGAAGISGVIPPNSTLVFEIELLGAK